jgi:hypothetical protein
VYQEWQGEIDAVFPHLEGIMHNSLDYQAAWIVVGGAAHGEKTDLFLLSPQQASESSALTH